MKPNPFRTESTLEFTLSISGEASVEIFDAQGNRVATLFRGKLTQGDHRIVLNMDDLPSGLYHVVLSGPEGSRDDITAVLVQ